MQREGVLGHGRLAVAGHVRDGHPAFAAGGEVEVIDRRRARGDEAQPRVRGEEIRR